jgi:hypothetical protein
MKEKLLGWQAEWEKIRVPLVEEYRELKFKFSKREVSLHGLPLLTTIRKRLPKSEKRLRM